MALVTHLRWLFSHGSPVSTIPAIQQAGSRGDRDLDLLEEALMATRNRVKASPRADTLLEQRAGLMRCLQPLVTWLDGENDLKDLETELRSDLIWKLFASCIACSQGADAFRMVTGNIDSWAIFFSRDSKSRGRSPTRSSTSPRGDTNE